MAEADKAHLAAIRDHADELLEQLHEAQDRVLDEARSVAAILTGENVGDPWSGSDAVQAAKRRAKQLANKVADIKLAYNGLCRSTFGEPKHDDLFGEWRNADEVWGPRLKTRRQLDWRPDPTDPVEALLWTAGIGRFEAAAPVPWLPTPQERDERYRQWRDSQPAVQRAS